MFLFHMVVMEITFICSQRALSCMTKHSNLQGKFCALTESKIECGQSFSKLTWKVQNVASIILREGAGTRLFPLTSQRAKPAVPIGGCYRPIEVPLSNCINSGIRKIFILTQFNSFSLNRHLARTYNFGNGMNFSDGFVEVLAATQTPGEAGKR
ncbi:hypothetical protein F0562_008291 [Nyssa sinensis]|uniref:glucose-1-phosphate adenylyltransferase n=1 Tax=Nyssa sinensis TaxID=561372 RepID=A0A5J5A9L4_9ASTE|nr:hypothetical protein F0562_008291 [Nyssa sinensis]